MSRVFQFVSLAGVVVLIALVIMAIMALTGSYDPTYTNPPT